LNRNHEEKGFFKILLSRWISAAPESKP